MKEYNVIISSKAQSDLIDCVSFVLKVSKEAALNLANDIYESIESLASLPERNPLFQMPKSFPFQIRKLIIKDRYVALYSIEKDKVVVYRFLDSRRKLDHLI